MAHNPSENTVSEDRIEGTLHAEDSDSTRLTYTATSPEHGTVAINTDGTFVYTPGASYAGQDRFDLTVSDARSGLHIHGLARFLHLISFGLFGNSGHRTTQSVFIGFDRAVVASGLDSPVDFRFLPDERIVVAEKDGAIKVIEDGNVHEQPLVTLSVNTLGERGISGLAVDPDFAENGQLYVAYTTSALRNRLSRLTVVGNSAGSELVLLQSDEPAALNHQGGALGFGSDGTLYWGLGDNGFGLNSQDLTNLHGKIIRLNPDGTTPLDNPALGAGALPQIYAYGLRNPFRLAFTPDGDLLVADVGAASFEEVNLVTAGGNYGWPDAEDVCNSCSSINPIYTYPRGSGAAITSILVYDGASLGPAYLDKVFIADLVQGWIKVLTCTPDFTACDDPQDFDLQAGRTVVLAKRPDDNLYQLTYNPGELLRIAPPAAAA
ncbi:MAG: PQQ-dependent sugar dehydrogenase [Actinomycetia bacterium]|nr:PQQ-dependent sugar dehydrogenase [Actinomycetes bacterium]MCH9700791.1 PQQ-dependent sugar dehydrogenase [Actinomycetes bacterium]MCH9760614.1 PQQ-dependent sugar dehydrogenase [Actinomycetes bacterium]